MSNRDRELVQNLFGCMLVPICFALIVGFVGTPLALAHGSYIGAILCFILGVCAVLMCVLFHKATS